MVKSIGELLVEVAVIEVGLHLEGLKLSVLADSEVSTGTVHDRVYACLSESAFVEVVGFLYHVLFLDQCVDREFLESFLLEFFCFEPRYGCSFEIRV